MKINTNFCFFILLTLLPIFLVTGPFLPDLVVSLIAIFFLIKIFQGNYKFLIINKYSIFIFIFYLTALISSIISSNTLFSFESSLFYIRFYFFSLGSLILIILYERKLNILFLIMSLSILIVSIDAIFEHFNGTNILGNSAFPGRIAGFFGEEWIIGSYLIRLLPLNIFLFFHFRFYKNQNYSILFTITSLFSICTILLSGERAAILLLLLYSFSILIIYIFKFFTLKKILLFPLLLIVMSLPLSFDKSFNRIVEDINLHTSFDRNKNIYLTYYYNSFQMFKEKPLFGYGPRMYRIECKNYNQIYNHGCNTHPHNYYFQLLAENGIIGFSTILFFFLYFLKKLFYEIRNNNFKELQFIAKISLLLCFIINLWPLIPTTSFYNNWIGVVTYMPLIFYFYTVFKKKFSEIS